MTTKVALPRHGTLARYAKHYCRCDRCVEGHRNRGQERKVRHIMSSAVTERGPVEVGVLAQLEALPADARPTGLWELALALARDIDNPALASGHASLARQLAAMLAKLEEAKASARPRLAGVVSLVDRKKKAGAG